MVNFVTLVRRMAEASYYVSVSFLIAMMLLTVGNVLVRFLGGVIPGTYELVRLISAVMVSGALVYAGFTASHVRVNIVVRRLGQRTQQLFTALTSLIGVVLWALIAWAGAVYATEQWLRKEVTEILEVPWTPFRYVWVLGVVILCLVLLTDMFKSATKVHRK